ncbi:hypothetical protein ACQ4PT_043746 [Festuca glaucescens]
MSGLLSTETFTFESVPGGCYGCRDNPNVLVPNVNFGCSTSATNLSFVTDGIVGLNAAKGSLIAQLGATFGWSASSALNFGVRAAVAEPGAATTPLVRPHGYAVYALELESVRIGNAIFQHLSNIIIDSGSTLTYLHKELLDPIVAELSRHITLPRVPSPKKLLPLCYRPRGAVGKYWFNKAVPDVTLQLAIFGQAVTLMPENAFAEVQEGTMCLAMAPVTVERPVVTLGNIAQQNMHVGYDLDKGTVTIALANCARSYNSPPVHG